MSFRCLVGSPFPNVDGTCINEEGPDMGAIGAKFLRLLSPTPGQGGEVENQSLLNCFPISKLFHYFVLV